MKKASEVTFVLLLLHLAARSSTGADFPLERAVLTPQQAALCYANGPSTGLAARVPYSLRRQPKAVSGYPLYGSLQVGTNAPLVFRLDESQGSGRGYDRLIFDLRVWLKGTCRYSWWVPTQLARRTVQIQAELDLGDTPTVCKAVTARF